MFYMLTAQVDCERRMGFFYSCNGRHLWQDTIFRCFAAHGVIFNEPFSSLLSVCGRANFFVKMRNCVQQLGLGVLSLHSIQYIMRKSYLGSKAFS